MFSARISQISNIFRYSYVYSLPLSIQIVFTSLLNKVPPVSECLSAKCPSSAQVPDCPSALRVPECPLSALWVKRSATQPAITCSKLTIERRRFGVFIVNFKHISHLCSSVSFVNFEQVNPGWQHYWKWTP